MKTILLALAALMLTGCTTTAPVPRPDVLTFDRGAFGLFWGGFSEITKATLCKKNADDPKCVAFTTQDESIRKQITTPPAIVAPPPSSIDMEQIMKILGALGKAAL